MKFKNKKILVNESNYNELKNKSSKQYSFIGQKKPNSDDVFSWCSLSAFVGLLGGAGITIGLLYNYDKTITSGIITLVSASSIYGIVGIRYAIYGIANKISNYKNSKIKNIQQAVIEYEQKQIEAEQIL